jgi:hypothetical protein
VADYTKPGVALHNHEKHIATACFKLKHGRSVSGIFSRRAAQVLALHQKMRSKIDQQPFS